MDCRPFNNFTVQQFNKDRRLSTPSPSLFLFSFINLNCSAYGVYSSLYGAYPESYGSRAESPGACADSSGACADSSGTHRIATNVPHRRCSEDCTGSEEHSGNKIKNSIIKLFLYLLKIINVNNL